MDNEADEINKEMIALLAKADVKNTVLIGEIKALRQQNEALKFLTKQKADLERRAAEVKKYKFPDYYVEAPIVKN